jgi:transcriptional regulator with XRE-family HTH domain
MTKRSVEDAFRENLRVTREEMEVSQSELARRIGVSQQTIAKIEHGGQRVRLDDAARVADALGVPLVALLPPNVQGREIGGRELKRVQGLEREIARRVELIDRIEKDLLELRAELATENATVRSLRERLDAVKRGTPEHPRGRLTKRDEEIARGMRALAAEGDEPLEYLRDQLGRLLEDHARLVRDVIERRLIASGSPPDTLDDEFLDVLAGWYEDEPMPGIAELRKASAILPPKSDVAAALSRNAQRGERK